MTEVLRLEEADPQATQPASPVEIFQATAVRRGAVATMSALQAVEDGIFTSVSPLGGVEVSSPGDARVVSSAFEDFMSQEHPEIDLPEDGVYRQAGMSEASRN